MVLPLNSGDDAAQQPLKQKIRTAFDGFDLPSGPAGNLMRFFFLQLERSGQGMHQAFMHSKRRLELMARPGSPLWVRLEKKRKWAREAFERAHRALFLKRWDELYKTQKQIYKQASALEAVVDDLLDKLDDKDAALFGGIKNDVAAIRQGVEDDIKRMEEEQTPPSEPSEDTFDELNERAYERIGVLDFLRKKIYNGVEALVSEPEVSESEPEPVPAPSRPARSYPYYEELTHEEDTRFGLEIDLDEGDPFSKKTKNFYERFKAHAARVKANRAKAANDQGSQNIKPTEGDIPLSEDDKLRPGPNLDAA